MDRRISKMPRRTLVLLAYLSVGSIFQFGCISEIIDDAEQRIEALVARVNENGATLEGEEGTIFEGVRIEVPPGALSEETELTVLPVDESLPEGAVGVGPMFELQSDNPDAALTQALEVTLPFDFDIVAGEGRTAEEVKVWVSTGDEWGQELQIESTADSVTVGLGDFSIIAPGVDRNDATTGTMN